MTQRWLLYLAMSATAYAQTAATTPAAPKKKAEPAAHTASYKDLKFPPPKPIPVPHVETMTLANGMKVYLVEDHELPLISGSARIRTGNLFDPADKVGLATLTGMVMRTGGTRKQSGEAIDQALENQAATVESSISESAGSVTFNGLKENLGSILDIFHDVLTAPEFRQERLDLAKAQLHGMVARRNDSAAAIAEREFTDHIYGPQTAYGWRMEHATVDAVTRADLFTFYRRYYFPANVHLAIWGDFDTADMKARIEKLFADWTVKQEPVPEFPQVTQHAEAAILLAPKGDMSQTFFTIGGLGGEFKDKDYAALEIAANILGGGAQGRLFQQVRTRMGAAYTINASWKAAYDHPGLFEISGSTKNLSTMETIRAIYKELERMRSTEVSDDELRVAKETALNSLVFAFDTQAKTLGRMLTYDYYGYPADFIQQYQKALEGVTRADVLRVAKEHFDPGTFTVVAVGNPDTFDEPLEKLGKPVTTLNMRIAPPSITVTSSHASGSAQRILSRAQRAVGGVEKLTGIKDLDRTSDFALSAEAGGFHVKMHERWMGPDYFRQDSDVPGTSISAYYDGTDGWIATSKGEKPLADPELSQVRGALFRLYFRLLLSDRLPGRTVTAAGDGGLDISSSAGDTAFVTFDKDTGLPFAVSYRAAQTNGPALTVQESFSDFRDVDGILLPFKIVIMQGAHEYATVTIQEMKLNTGLKIDDLAQKPAAGAKK